MKNVKKIACLVLALSMLFTLGIVAIAEGGTNDGSITINGVLKGNTYSIYKIFDLESFDPTNDAYTYTINSTNPMYSIVSGLQIDMGTADSPKMVNAFKLTQKGTSDVYYVTLGDGVGQVSATDKTTPKKIADALLAAIKKNGTITPTRTIDKLATDSETKTDNNDTVVKDAADTTNTKYDITFGNLGLGYYLIDTSAGTMLGLTTTQPTATITAKNELPGIEKKVLTHATGKWEDANSKQIGETVTFRTSVTVEAGAKNYTVYDAMGKGLEFKGVTKIYYANSTPSKAFVIYDTKSDPVIDKITDEVTVTTENVTYNGTAMDFKIEFTDEFAAEVYKHAEEAEKDHNIYIEYEAVVTKDAEIGNAKGNKNETWLTYGDNNVEVSKDETTTYVFKFDIVKTDKNKKVLTGAQFELYKDQACTEIVRLVKLDKTGDSGETVYRVAVDTDPDDKVTTTIDAGHVQIEGLGAGFDTQNKGRAYYLKEIKAPDGYNQLAAAQEFRITGGKDKDKPEIPDAIVTVEGVYDKGGVQIINNKGSLLPETGGMGTTVFYIIGGLLLAGAAVLLVTRKRMSAVKESK